MAREHVHLIGIGGTGMTALAGLLVAAGCRVTGSDKRLYPPTSTILERLGFEITPGFDPEHLRPAPDLVVVGNAISRGNPEVEEVLDHGLAYTSMPVLVAERFLFGRHSIVVTGTHGKTTTAAMTAWVLEQAGRSPGFLIGGSPINFELPFQTGRGSCFVIEGDEYDSAFFDKGPKFMHYRPNTALVGTVEFDHADIYRDVEQVKTAFSRLVNLVPRRGLVVRHEENETTVDVTSGAFSRIEGYGFETGQWRAVNLVEEPAGTRFEVLHEEGAFAEIRLRSAGRHNVRNALAALAAAHEQGLSAQEISTGLGSFEGVRRRLELRGEVDDVLVFDDFAHHPTAVCETLDALRRRFPAGRLWAVLEPRSWSLRRNVFQERLARSFDAADEVIIAGVYEAEAIPVDQRLDAGRLVEEIRSRGTNARYREEVERIVAELGETVSPGDVVVVMSNGGFGGLHERLLGRLRERAEPVRRTP